MRGDKPCLEYCESVSFWIAINAVGKRLLRSAKLQIGKLRSCFRNGSHSLPIMLFSL